MNEMKKIEQVEVEKKNEKGATMIEYAILAALISIIAIVAIRTIGTNVSQGYSKIASQTTGL